MLTYMPAGGALRERYYCLVLALQALSAARFMKRQALARPPRMENRVRAGQPATERPARCFRQRRQARRRALPALAALAAARYGEEVEQQRCLFSLCLCFATRAPRLRDTFMPSVMMLRYIQLCCFT